ncbi:DnaD domain-containing protein, partial [Treponema sp. R6D11]
YNFHYTTKGDISTTMEHLMHMYYGFIDEYLTEASPIYSLVYLYALRFASEGKQIPNISAQAEALRLVPSDINSAWLFWVSQGLASIDGEDIKLTMIPEKSAKESADIQKQVDAHPQAPSDELVSWVLNEANRAFDDTLSARDIETLEWLLNNKILPPEVLLLLINFSREGDNKKTMSYIEKVALDWQDRGINTALKAEEFIKSMQKKPKYNKNKKSKQSSFHNFKERDYAGTDEVYNRLFDAMGQ